MLSTDSSTVDDHTLGVANSHTCVLNFLESVSWGLYKLFIGGHT